MALTSIALNIRNNEYKGYVEIASVPKKTTTQATYALLFRKEHDSAESFYKIYEKAVESIVDLSFYIIDITTASGKTYDYRIELTNGNSTGYSIYEFATIQNIQSYFDGLFVGNMYSQFFAPLNCETSTVRKTHSNYVTTLTSRTPYRISNSNLNYTTGSSSALFMPIDNDGRPVKQETREYLNTVIDFLTDGSEKVLKTSDGGIWCVTIDDDVQTEFNDYYVGSSQLSFNWTEIDDVTVFIDDSVMASKLIWKTIVDNGIHYPSTDYANGYNRVEVSVPIITSVGINGHSIVVTRNGVNPIYKENVEYIDSANLSNLSVTTNGIYQPQLLSDIDGYKSVDVSVYGIRKVVTDHTLSFEAPSESV